MHRLVPPLLFVVVLTACPGPGPGEGPLDAAVALSDAGVDAGSSGPDASTVAPDAGIDAGVDAGPMLPRVSWRACPLKTSGLGGPAAECAVLLTPLRASEPGGDVIEYFVKRYRPPGGRGLRAVWMLQGGPGASGLVFETLAEQMGTRFPDVDYYFPDHRGTGRSTRLGCPAQEAESSEGGIYITAAEWPACRASVQSGMGPALSAFTTTNAANDVGLAIAATRQPYQGVFVFGISYGTYLAMRYLQLFPTQADGVVLDSIAGPGSSLYRQDEDANEAARDYFAACARDSVCGAKLGVDPWAKAQSLFARLKTGHCAAIALPDAPTHVVFRRAFGSLLMDPALRGYVAPIVHRADRCSADDVAALTVLMGQLTQQPLSPPDEHRLWGWVLSQNILHSEMGESPRPTAAQLAAIREAAVASRDVTEGFEMNLDWPVYAADPFVGRWPDTATPVLMLQGGLDPATLLRKARAAQAHFQRSHQTWVEVPTATHTVIASSPYVNAVGERRSCGTAMLMAFVENPTATVDTSCVAAVQGIDWTLPNTNYNLALFGRRDAWE